MPSREGRLFFWGGGGGCPWPGDLALRSVVWVEDEEGDYSAVIDMGLN